MLYNELVKINFTNIGAAIHDMAIRIHILCEMIPVVCIAL